MKKIIALLSTLFLFSISACSSDESNSQISNNTTQDKGNGNTTSSFTDKYSTSTNGYVTWYDGAADSTVAYYTPELISGWYHCAVSEPKYDELPAGTAIELSANGKTVHLLVTDLCPSASNSNHTSKANYFFDLEKSAFTSLAEASVGELQMSFKTIPYPTSSNIKFLAKDGINQWWLSGKFYNCR